MAIKIIKHGKETFKAVCPICGCEFEYEFEDLTTQYGIAKQVVCPDCGERINHNEHNVVQPHIIYSWPAYPTVVWSSDSANLDCEKCPNKPDKTKIVVGDTPCTWCKKNIPYCTADITNWKINPDNYTNTTITFSDLNLNTKFTDIKTAYVTSIDDKNNSK